MDKIHSAQSVFTLGSYLPRDVSWIQNEAMLASNLFQIQNIVVAPALISFWTLPGRWHLRDVCLAPCVVFASLFHRLHLCVLRMQKLMYRWKIRMKKCVILDRFKSNHRETLEYVLNQWWILVNGAQRPFLHLALSDLCVCLVDTH